MDCMRTPHPGQRGREAGVASMSWMVELGSQLPRMREGGWG